MSHQSHNSVAPNNPIPRNPTTSHLEKQKLIKALKKLPMESPLVVIIASTNDIHPDQLKSEAESRKIYFIKIEKPAITPINAPQAQIHTLFSTVLYLAETAEYVKFDNQYCICPGSTLPTAIQQLITKWDLTDPKFYSIGKHTPKVQDWLNESGAVIQLEDDLAQHNPPKRKPTIVRLMSLFRSQNK